MPMIKTGVRIMNYEDTGIKDIFMPTAFAEDEKKRYIRGQFVQAIAHYMDTANPPYLIRINELIDAIAALMIEKGEIDGYKIETSKADSVGFHIDMIVYPKGKYWSDMYFTILTRDEYKQKCAAFDRAMKGV